MFATAAGPSVSCALTWAGWNPRGEKGGGVAERGVARHSCCVPQSETDLCASLVLGAEIARDGCVSTEEKRGMYKE